MDNSAATITADPTTLLESGGEEAQNASLDAVELLASDLQNAANDDTQPEGSVDEPAFEDLVQSAIEKIGGELLFRVHFDNAEQSEHVAAVSMGNGDERQFVLIILPADGGPVRVEPAGESANPLAALAESYAGVAQAYKAAA